MDFNDREIIRGIAAGDSRVIDYCYKTYRKKIRRFIVHCGGNTQDADDIFQEALMAIWAKKGLVLTCTFSTYFHQICKFILSHKLEKQKKMSYISDLDTSVLSDEDILEAIVDAERMRLFDEHLGGLDAGCRSIVEMTCNGMKSKEIAEKLGLSFGYVRARKLQCIGRLFESIKKDPRFHELISK